MSHLKLCSLCILPSLCPLAKSLTLKYVLQAPLQPRKENLLVGMNFMGALSAKKTTFLKPPSSQYCMKILHNHKNYSEQISHQKPASDFNYIDLSQYIPTQVMGRTARCWLQAGLVAGTDGAGCCLDAQQQSKACSLRTYYKGSQEVLCPLGLQPAVLCYAKATQHSRHGEVSQH